MTGVQTCALPIFSDLGELDPSDVARAITPKTKFLAISHMSNVLGTKTALAEIVRLAHERGVPVLADGCQGAVHGIVDVRALDVDFYAVTGHKLYGPTGIGALYGKRSLLKTMRPYQGGGEMIREVTRANVTYADAPMRFEAGTPPIIETVGLAAALDYIDGVGREAAAAHEAALTRLASKRLKELNGVRIIGEAKDKGPLISFEAVGIHPHDTYSTTTNVGPPAAGWSSGFRATHWVRQVMDANGDTAKRIWATEAGTASCQSYGGYKLSDAQRATQIGRAHV